MFVGLNPSTADEKFNDPTIRRCISFAQAWGYGAMCITNLFAFRASKPKVMKSHPSPIGFRNNYWLIKSAECADKIIVAWGVNGKHLNRNQVVETLFENLWCLGTTRDGHPRHPLFVKKNFEPIRYATTGITNKVRVMADSGRAELIVQDATAREEMLDAIRGIQRGLDAGKTGKGKPFRVVLDEIRAKYNIPRSQK